MSIGESKKIENMPPKIESLPEFIENFPPVLHAYYWELQGNGVACTIPNKAAGGFCFMQFFSDSPKIQCDQGGMTIHS